MEVRKGLLLFGISVLVTACFNPPEFSVVPQIDFVGIYFKDGTTDSPTDSLVVTISFKDGDGDLGLSPTQIEDPYQDVFYAIAENGNVTEVSKKTEYGNLPQFVSVPAGASGKLVTVRTLQDPSYAGKLPPYIDEIASCKDYRRQTLYINEPDADIIDDTYPDVDTLVEAGFPKVFVVEDLFYKRNNPKHLNIEVEFYEKQPGGDYTLFDWEKEYCETAFDQRFPILSEKEGPLEGNLTYALTSLGIRANFSIKTLKLRIRIRDRAFNVSNDVETGDFTLDKIKR